MKRTNSWKTLAVLGLVVVLAAVAVAPVAAQDSAPARTITVSGIGQAMGTPDVAFVQLGVEATNADLLTAFTQTNTTIEDVIAAITEAGVAQEDIQTQGLNIFPEERFGPSGPIVTEGPEGPMPERIFRARNTLSITVRDVERAGEVIDAAVNAGANNVFGLSFGIDDPTALEAEARDIAVANARARAEQLAEALGVSVGAPVSISETFGGDGIFPEAQFAFGLGGGGGAPINEGQLSVSVQVRITFQLVAADEA